MRTTALNRRIFLKGSIVGGLAAMTSARLPGLAAAAEALAAAPATGAATKPRVALTAGDDRAANAFRGLDQFRDEIAKAIGDRPVVVKPNFVDIAHQLAATHVNCIEGILEFLKSVGKLGNAVIAESAANGPAAEGFDNYGYAPVAKKYGVKLVDLDQEGHTIVQVFDEARFPSPCRADGRATDGP